MAANLSEIPATPNTFRDEAHQADMSRLQAMTSTASMSRDAESPTNTESVTEGTHVQIQGDPAAIGDSLNVTKEDDSAGLPTGKKFTIFSKLPTELRLIAWEMALPGPRGVCVWLMEDGDSGGQIEDQRNTAAWKFRSSEKSPAILFACKESRMLALKHYKLLESNYHDSILKMWYIAPLKDILYLVDSNWKEGYSAVDIIASAIPNLTTLALCEDELASEKFRITDLLGFDALETLIIIPLIDWIHYTSSTRTLELDNHNCPAWWGHFVDLKELMRSLGDVEKKHTGWKAPRLRIGER